MGEKPSQTPNDGVFDFQAAQSLFFASQTIQNACGTQALLSVLLNQGKSVVIGPQLQEFKEFTAAFPSEVLFESQHREIQRGMLTSSLQLRGEALSNSELIRDVHNSFARSSPFIDEAQRLASGDDEVYHFIAYTPINGLLYELDGLQPAPISHGTCTFSDFPDKVIPVLQRRIERYPVNEIRFNLMAMVRDLRLRAREVGDEEWLYREKQKRNGWQWENALRRHNFIGLTGEVLKGVVRSKLKENGQLAFDEWVEDAKRNTKARIREGAYADESVK